MKRHNFTLIDVYYIEEYASVGTYRCRECELYVYSMNEPSVINGQLISQILENDGRPKDVVYKDISVTCEEVMIEKLLQA